MSRSLQPSENRDQVLTVLQAGRAFAAFAVVIHHAALGAAVFVAALPAPLAAVTNRGYLGVDFFFVLSGFIIYHTNRGRPKSRHAAYQFAWRRLIRIFVPYLPISLALITAYLAFPAVSAADRDWGWLASLFLLPTPQPPALSIAWTLQHEMVFYLLFAALFFSGNLVLGCAAWALAIIAINLAVMPGDAGLWAPLKFPFALINLEFLFGMVAAHLAMRPGPRPRVLGSWVLLCLGLATLAVFIVIGTPRELSAIFGLAIALVLVPVVRLEARGALKAGPWLMFLGGASYSLYLVNAPIVSITARAAARLPLLDTWPGAVLFSIAVPTLVAALYHVVIERPGLVYARRLVLDRGARPPVV